MVHSIQKAQNIVGGKAVYSLKNRLSFKAFAYINFESRDVSVTLSWIWLVSLCKSPQHIDGRQLTRITWCCSIFFLNTSFVIVSRIRPQNRQWGFDNIILAVNPSTFDANFDIRHKKSWISILLLEYAIWLGTCDDSYYGFRHVGAEVQPNFLHLIAKQREHGPQVGGHDTNSQSQASNTSPLSIVSKTWAMFRPLHEILPFTRTELYSAACNPAGLPSRGWPPQIRDSLLTRIRPGIAYPAQNPNCGQYASILS